MCQACFAVLCPPACFFAGVLAPVLSLLLLLVVVVMCGQSRIVDSSLFFCGKITKKWKSLPSATAAVAALALPYWWREIKSKLSLRGSGSAAYGWETTRAHARSPLLCVQWTADQNWAGREGSRYENGSHFDVVGDLSQNRRRSAQIYDKNSLRLVSGTVRDHAERSCFFRGSFALRPWESDRKTAHTYCYNTGCTSL